jgi:hypothetical protein
MLVKDMRLRWRRGAPVALLFALLALYLWQTAGAWQEALLQYTRAKPARTVWRGMGVRLNNLTGTATVTGASATLIASTPADTGVLLVEDLPVLPPTEVYRLWGIDPLHNIDAAATFNVPYESRDAVAVPVITPQFLTTYSRFLITVEPIDGDGVAPSGRVVMSN